MSNPDGTLSGAAGSAESIPPSGAPAAAPSKRHLLTIALEDYFHVNAFHKIIQHRQWYRFETRLERNTQATLEVLERFGVKATFFVSGWVADTLPEMVRGVARRGHEIASMGYYHRGIEQMTPAEFTEDLARSREAIERASETRVLGYRAAHGGLVPSDLWVLDVLAQEGYAYDSSIVPIFRSFASEPWRRFAHRHRHAGREIWEFPVSTWKFLGLLVPIAGGNYFRQFPHTLVKQAVAQWNRKFEAPFVMYFHTWELDPEQPRINAASLLSRIRHYRNLDKMSWVLEDYFRKYRFTSIADFLGLEIGLDAEARSRLAARAPAPAALAIGARPAASAAAPDRRTPVTVVIPCYNERLILPYLANTLSSVEASFEKDYDLRFILVDDGSVDGTREDLQRIFGQRSNFSCILHEKNRGVAAAILTGIRSAATEIVCSIDCDCTYDPHELRTMIPLLAEGVDLVTASPYHPQGAVRNVPAWRLSLSKSASWLYRQILHQKIHTYTSCFRVYRRSAVTRLDLREGHFLGIAELAGKLDLSGSRIVEHPAVLESRMLGHSKMKVLRTIAGHLRLLWSLLFLRLRGNRAPSHSLPPTQSQKSTR